MSRVEGLSASEVEELGRCERVSFGHFCPMILSAFELEYFFAVGGTGSRIFLLRGSFASSPCNLLMELLKLLQPVSRVCSLSLFPPIQHAQGLGLAGRWNSGRRVVRVLC